MGLGFADCASGSVLLRGTWGGVSESGRPLRLSRTRPRPALGISVWLDEFVAGAARRNGRLSRGIRTISGIPVPRRRDSAFSIAPGFLCVRLHYSPAVSGLNCDPGNRAQLL